MISVLQHMLMPKAGVCNQTDMFFRMNKKVHLTDEMKTLTFRKYGVVWFDTYFNSLSIGKWVKYTNIGRVYIRLKLRGKFEISLMRKEKVEDNIIEEILSITSFESTVTEIVTIPFEKLEKQGMLFVRLEAICSDSVFFEGEYCAEIDESSSNNVFIAINICTFKREAFLLRNLEVLNNAILNNHQNALYEHLQVFISDNGKTLDSANISSDKIHIVPNKNVGGAGGFSRGLIEIMHFKDFKATHCLFMDDDIIIEPEVLYRTFMILKCAKEKYRDAFVGGAMLRLDQPNIQVEAGAVWNSGNLDSLKHGLNLNSVDAVLYNEVEETAEYNAWWYCCTPMSVVKKDNLPLPIFIRGDDLEYGLRNMKYLILMNGICVWHEPFENKYSSFLNYYIIRNLLYDNALHCPKFTKRDFIKKMREMILRELVFYRYKNVDLIFRGVKDFFKGVEFLKMTDGENLHKEIMAEGYLLKSIDEADMQFSYPTYERSLSEKSSRISRLFRIFTFNGLFLPTKRDTIVSMTGCRSINCYRARKVMFYDSYRKTIFITERDVFKTISLLLKMYCIELEIYRKFDNAVISFRKECGDLFKEEQWKSYLGLK